jgi:hypothetical protein
MPLADKIQHADWRQEKHVPVIECPDQVPSDEFFDVKVTLGKALAHPNTTETMSRGSSSTSIRRASSTPTRWRDSTWVLTGSR